MTGNIISIDEHNVEYKNDKFLIKNYDFNIQYYPYYRKRLEQMKQSLISAAKQRWPYISIYTINDLADSKNSADTYSQNSNDDLLMNDDNEEKKNSPLYGKDIIVYGLLLKRMLMQPNILKELDDERKLVEPQSANSNVQKKFTSSNDQLFLQDGDESIELKGDELTIDEFCTGICMATKGHLNPNGSGFIVEDYCFALINNSIVERPLIPDDLYILMISGLNYVGRDSDKKYSQSLNLIFDLIAGQSESNKKIASLIIAGNSISSSNESANESMKILDNFLANIGQYMFVDIMPGNQDLTTGLYPQQPLHPCLFPKAYHLTSIRSTTNPHRAKYFGVDFLGTSGENLHSIRQCTKWNEPIEIMRNILLWGHIAPSCPDLLHSYPFADHDPLVIDEYPDVFFAGNQSEFGFATFNVPNFDSNKTNEKTIRLISIPSFKEKQMGVLINIRTLECEMLAFN